VPAGCHGALDELPLVDFVIGAAGVAEPPAQERPRRARLRLLNFDGAQSVRFKVDARRPNSSVEETPCRPDSILFGSLPFYLPPTKTS
jgi:hypothetical protein